MGSITNIITAIMFALLTEVQVCDVFILVLLRAFLLISTYSLRYH
jgi:hypothetical protein